ncbi:MAG: TetR/AcrR family transcriptional regulator, partial [Betaproteobacteria bacterium]
MVGVRAKNHDDKRQMILDQSATLFARQGFHKTSIAEIAKACKASSKAWIYHYFPNKEAVLATLITDFLEIVIKRVGEAIASEQSPELKLKAFVLECMRIYDEYRINYPILFAEMTLLPFEQQKPIRALERRWVQMLQEIVVALNPKITSKRHHAMVLTLIASGSVNWTYTWFDPKGPLSQDEVAEMTTRML